MLVALEFYVRCLNDLPVPCSFCLEGAQGDRKVVTLNEAYRHPELVAVKHWHLSECLGNQSLPSISERTIPRKEVFDSSFVVVPGHRLLSYHAPFIESSLNLLTKPMPEDKFSSLYDNFFRTDVHLFHKETWVWREFLRAYLSWIAYENDEIGRLREVMSWVALNEPALWHKWLHWRRYMIDFGGMPGEIVFCRQYPHTFSFS